MDADAERKDANLARELLSALLKHPETVVVVDTVGRIRLAFEDELSPTRGSPEAG